MPDDTVEPVGGIHGRAIERVGDQHAHAVWQPGMLRLAGHIVSMQRGTGPHEGGHRLDVTVGGGEQTELIVQVPAGAYANLTGRRVVVIVHPEE